MAKQDEIKKKLKTLIFEKIDFSRELPDEEIKDIIDKLIIEESKRQRIDLEERKRLRQELFYSIRKLDILQELVDDTSVTEIMILKINCILNTLNIIGLRMLDILRQNI